MAAYYDCQLANIESLVLESIGIDRKVLTLIIKILPHFKHYIYTGFGISSSFYSDEQDEYGGTGQGNIFSGESYKVKSYRVIKHLEKQDLRINIKLLITKQLIQWLATAFIDDTSFYSSGNDFMEKIQQIVNQYTILYEATGGLIEYDKSYSYS